MVDPSSFGLSLLDGLIESIWFGGSPTQESFESENYFAKEENSI